MLDKNIKKIEETVTDACKTTGVALYDIEFKTAQKGKVLIIYLTKTGGVTIEDCAKVSRLLNDMPEMEDLIPGKYFLEVSSAGLERQLKLKKHYTSAINENVKINYRENEDKKSVTGKLIEVLPDKVIIETDNKENISVLFTSIKKAKTYFTMKKEKI
ncbi:MAG: ribosome assembly cofactor RimP [Candidatus Cloacimonadota bacterium]|nr:MAG: ribosome assembly cofactor RimP [Candidatus Cloacimonadota bacterium]